MNSADLLVSLDSLLVNSAGLLVFGRLTREFRWFTREFGRLTREFSWFTRVWTAYS
ncbi:hypothetical protein ABIE66_004325 [Peribacillus sp. B2I2]|uniref:hypothetical protein n=1 Tax=Peribacillus sp. B2I2 TaxID=3156468 RepID=UPI0035126475